MIFYFSATGNSKYVAARLADATKDKIVSITECLKNGLHEFVLEENENIGFVTPTYFWGLPSVVTDFLQRMKIKKTGAPYVYHVLTFGTTAGQAHRMMEKYLQNKALSLDGKFIVRMTDTWTPIFDLSDKGKNQTILTEAEKQIDTVAGYVSAHTKGDFNNRKIPLAGVYYWTYRHGRRTKKFTVDNTCIGCGLCERQCPVSAIKLQNKKPVWVKEQCALCLGCLHRCPKFSIQYGKNTKNHGQYVNPNVKL